MSLVLFSNEASDIELLSEEVVRAWHPCEVRSAFQQKARFQTLLLQHWI
jgi:hypothetical protein